MRILLADDQPKVKFALRVLLKQQPNLQVVGEASAREDLMNMLDAIRPDMVLLAWELPGLDMVGSVLALRQICPGLLIIALSGQPGARRASLGAGVDAFVSKGDPPDRLLTAIYNCWRGRRKLEGQIGQPIASSAA